MRIAREQITARLFPAVMLEIEITEEAAMHVQAMTPKLFALTEMGVGISINDFGSGYSLPESLRMLHASGAKIDRSFTTGLATSQDHQALVKAVVSRREPFKCEVISEGGENEHDLVMLRQLNCHTAQGYYFGKPMTAEVALALRLPTVMTSHR